MRIMITLAVGIAALRHIRILNSQFSIINSEGGVIERGAVGMFADNPFDDGFHESLLEVQRCFDACEGQPQQSVAHAFR